MTEFVRKSREEMEAIPEFAEVIDALKSVHDPEVGLDIWNLELVYALEKKDRFVRVVMTFTSPLCPFGPELVAQIEAALKEKGFNPAVEVVIDPPWQPSEYVKELLGLA